MKYLSWLKALVFLLCLFPLGRLGWLAYTRNLGANPIEFLSQSTGTWTLVFLLLTLSVSPTRELTGQHWLAGFRRMFGLYAFFYVCLHFTTYIGLDQFFDIHEILKDVAKRRFIMVGLLSFSLLVPLALTSTRRMMAKLGGKRWQRLHRLVYVSAIGGVIHYLWLVKADLRQPLIYGAILAVLLGYRLVTRLAPWLAGKFSAKASPVPSQSTLTRIRP